MVNKRIKWIDVFRGIAILLVVIGHLEIPQYLYNLIFSFHMFIFYFISGVVYKDNNTSYFIERCKIKIKKFYIPYLSYAILWFSSSLVIEWYKNKEVLFFYNFKFLKKVLCIIWGNGIFTEGASIGPAWFLISLLVVSIFYDFCKTYIYIYIFRERGL